MTFSPAQQAQYRPLVEQAWQRHCGFQTLLPADKGAARDAWYREQLHMAAGIYTTKDARRGDFLKLMVHFERLCGDSIRWATAQTTERYRNAMWQINKLIGEGRIDRPYAEAIARRSYERGLDDLGAAEAEQVLRWLRSHLVIEKGSRGAKRRAAKPATP